MKRVISLLLALCLSLSMAACGSSKKAEEESIAAQNAAKEKGEEIYTLLTDAYNKVDEIGGSVYGVWAKNVSSAKRREIQTDPVKVLLPATKLSREDFRWGIFCALAESASENQTRDEILDLVHNATEEEIAQFDNITDEDLGALFVACSDMVKFSVLSVQDAYYLNGGIEFAQTALESAKEAIKEVADMDVQPEGIESLKSIYVATSSYLDFCLNTEGSVLQAADKINGFTTTVKTAMAELELVY